LRRRRLERTRDHARLATLAWKGRPATNIELVLSEPSVFVAPLSTDCVARPLAKFGQLRPVPASARPKTRSSALVERVHCVKSGLNLAFLDG
jgi:hypothetical protein